VVVDLPHDARAKLKIAALHGGELGLGTTLTDEQIGELRRVLELLAKRPVPLMTEVSNTTSATDRDRAAG
jgi:hypothetical protein